MNEQIAMQASNEQVLTSIRYRRSDDENESNFQNGFENGDFVRNVAEAFRAASLITGSLWRGEQLVLLAIHRVDVSCLHSRGLVAEVVSLSTADITEASPQEKTEVANDLPEEMRKVLLLEVQPRRCFVARVLLGFSLGDCVQLLDVDAVQITLSLLTAVRGLSPQACSLKSALDVKRPCLD